MRPYGWRQTMWRDVDGGPTSKHSKITSKNRHRSRQLLHKGERARTKQEIYKMPHDGLEAC
jgi:hypothetical protein